MQEPKSFTLSKDRLVSFSDGVFAIAITLLVLELHLPNSQGSSTAGQQARDLIAIWPQYLVYFVSFASIGIMWLNHHALFRNVLRVTHGTVIANLLLLALISFLPFPTEVLAQYGLTNIATVYYGLTMTLIAVGFTILYWQVLVAHPESTRVFTLWSVVGLTFYPLASLIGYFAPLAGIATMGLLAGFYMHPNNVRAIVIDA